MPRTTDETKLFQQLAQSRLREVNKALKSIRKAVKDDLPFGMKLEAIKLKVWAESLIDLGEREFQSEMARNQERMAPCPTP